MIFAKICWFWLALLCVASARRYDGYRVLRVRPDSLEAVRVLENLQQTGEFDFWTSPRLHKTDIMASPETIDRLESFLVTNGLSYDLMINNVQKLIESTQIATYAHGPRSLMYNLTWDSYHSLTEIEEFAYALAEKYPERVSVSIGGQSVEGRNITVVKLGTGTGKNVIYMDGGIHAREFIGPAVATWLIRELVENYEQHPQYLDNLEWVIMPVANPDGYTYAFTEDRMWRKNRAGSYHGHCKGVDLNRNFDFHWNEGGSSNAECYETYHGPEAFSEPESRAMRDVINGVRDRAAMYIALHSYGQWWLTPWGFTTDYPEDYDAMYALALNATQALSAVFGTQYTIGTSTNLLGKASGCSDDWSKGAAMINYTYVIELRDQGEYGFLLPPEQIQDTAFETWESIKVLADFAMGL